MQVTGEVRLETRTRCTHSEMEVQSVRYCYQTEGRTCTESSLNLSSWRCRKSPINNVSKLVEDAILFSDLV
jgi:hypothetical protein